MLVPLLVLGLPGGGSGIASAEDPELDPVVDLTDVLEGQGIDPWTNPLTAADNCWQDPGPQANVQNVVYKTFVKGSTTYSLYLDVYVPQTGAPPGPYPAAVTVHGGGWVGGCRVWLDGLDRQMAQRGFIVFNIDYRLACTDGTVYLCGFHYPTPGDDTKSAISWARTHAASYASYNGKVAGLGTSGGGNLIYMAGDTGTQNGSRPDAQAGASGFPELGYMSPPELQKMCDASPPGTEATCWSNNNDYMGFSLSSTPDWCGDGGGDNWSPAGPVCNASSSVPPTYIVNGTFELDPLRAATDFDVRLSNFLVLHQLCWVSQNGGSRHGTQLLATGVKCDQDPAGPDAVIKVFDFLRQYTT